MATIISRRTFGYILGGAIAAPSVVGRAHAQGRTLRYANATGDQAIANKFAAKLLTTIEERTNGELRGQLLLNNGSEQSIVEGVSLGTIDMCNSGYSGLREYDAFYTPTLLRDLDHAYRVSKSPLAAKAAEAARERYNVRVVGLGSSGSFLIGVKDPVEDWDGLAGRKIRIPPFESYAEASQILGIAATPVPFNEVYLALQQNLVSGLVTLLNVMLSSKFVEVCQNVISVDFGVGMEKFFMNDAAWNSLTPQQQEIFQGTYDELVQEHYFGAAKAQTAKDFTTWEELNGAGTVLELDGADLAQRMEPLTRSFADEVFGPGSFEQLQAA
jgi:TRAP-type C4-dicarboxylate transport system substrate-binding protein